MNDVLDVARANGHKMGHIFRTNITFCKCCSGAIYTERKGDKYFINTEAVKRKCIQE